MWRIRTVVLAAAFHVVCAHAGLVTWQSANGSWDGLWTDVSHWSRASGTSGVPAPGETNRVFMAAGGTVAMPAGGVTTQAEMAWGFYDGAPATLDATGSSFTLGPADPQHPYSKIPWYWWLNGITFGRISYDVSAYETIKTLSVFQLTNSKMTTRAAYGGAAEVMFSGSGADTSRVDLCDPVGGRKTGALPAMVLFQADQYQSDDLYPVARMAFTNLTSALPSVNVFGYPLERSHLLFARGTHTVHGTLIAQETGNTVPGETCVEATDGADVSLLSDVRAPYRRLLKLLVTDRACLNFQGAFGLVNAKGANLQIVVTNGATLAVKTPLIVGYEKTTDGLDTSSITARVCVADAALSVTANRLCFGNPQLNMGKHDFSVLLTNACVVATNAANSTDVVLFGGTLTSSDTDWTANVVSLKASTPALPAVMTFAGGQMIISNRLQLVGWDDPLADTCTNRFVQQAGTIRLEKDQELRIGENRGVSRYEMRGGTLSLAQGVIKMATTASSRGEFIVDGKDARVEITDMKEHFVGAKAAGAVGVLRVKEGTLEVDTATSHRIFIPHAAGATSIVEVTGGALKVKNGYGLGATFGTAIMDFSGGETYLQRFVLGTEQSETPESVATISGGTFTVPPYATTELAIADQSGIQMTANKGNNRCVRLRLFGGTVNANRIVAGVGSRCNGGTGWTVLEGNGGVVKLNGIGYQMVNGFDEARLGPKGLTIDSNGYATHIRQNFSNLPDVTGRLILTGAGEKTLYGTASAEAELVAAGGTVSFASGARHASALVVTNGASVAFSDAQANGVTSLTVGDEETVGTLILSPGRTVHVDGTVSLRNVRLVLDESYEPGHSYELLSASVPLDEVSRRAWAEALATGLGEGKAYSLTETTDASGNTRLSIAVRTAQDLEITLESGTRTIMEDLSFAGTEMLRTHVAEDAELTLAGTVGRGGLVKDGNGRTVLSNGGNWFWSGLSVLGGMLSGTSLDALGFDMPEDQAPLVLGTATLALGAAGESGRSPYALQIQTTAASDAAVLLCRADVTMTAPTVAQGCFIKRGPGCLTFETDAPASLGVHGGTQTDKNATPSSSTIVFDENGIPPAVQYTTLNVAEGELVLKGTGPAAHFKLGKDQALASTYVGMPVRGLAQQPRLTIDGAHATLQNNAHFHLGSGCKGSTSDATAPCLVLTNGATFLTTSFHNGYQADTAYHGRVLVDGSTFDFTEYIYSFRAGTERDGEPTWQFVNGSQLLSPNDNYHAVNFTGYPCTMLFDRSVFKGREGVASGRGRVCMFGANGTMIFRNGAQFLCDTLVWRSTGTLTLAFDDGVWNPSDGDYTFTAGESSSKLVVRTEGSGRGLVLAPPAGAVWTMAAVVSGEGAVTKMGAGTLTFATAPTCTGPIAVREGAVSFTGLSLQDATLTGAGTVRGGTFAGATYAVALDGEAQVPNRLTFDGVTFDGRTTVDLGRTESTAFETPYPADVLVATYVGAAPDVSSWRTTGTGSRHVSGSFAAANGEIRMTLVYKSGMVLLLK